MTEQHEKLKKLITNIKTACEEAAHPIHPVSIDLGMIERWAVDSLEILEALNSGEMGGGE